METFASLREHRIIRLTENKDRFIQKNTLLTDEQKQEVLDFFRSHANLENRIQNWNYNIPYETFKQVMDSVDTADKRLKKQTKELRKQNGLDSLIEGEDYILIGKVGDAVIYQPLTHKASRVIASNMVEPKLWCESLVMTWSPKEILPAGEPMKDDLYPGAKWCISMETDEHWSRYTHCGEKFFMVCNPNASTEKEKKICLTYNGNKFTNLTYADDSSIEEEPHDLTEIITEYLKKQLSENLKSISKYLNKETGKYDYLNKEFTPKDLIKDGKFIVPIGVWEGGFDCAHGGLTSLEGSPRIVERYFNCGYNQLTSLVGAPEKVGGNFRCLYSKLKSLEGAPRVVNGNFDCSNNNLISLQGAPEKVGVDFICSNNPLRSLEGKPKYIGGEFFK